MHCAWHIIAQWCVHADSNCIAKTSKWIYKLAFLFFWNVLQFVHELVSQAKPAILDSHCESMSRGRASCHPHPRHGPQVVIHNVAHAWLCHWERHPVGSIITNVPNIVEIFGTLVIMSEENSISGLRRKQHGHCIIPKVSEENSISYWYEATVRSLRFVSSPRTLLQSILQTARTGYRWKGFVSTSRNRSLTQA